MARTTHITFRGQEDVEIEYEDGGYEYDTNCQEINWWFTDPAMKDVEVTPQEDDAIYARIVEIGSEPEDPFWD